MSVLDGYLSREAPVLGLVLLGDSYYKAEHGYRAGSALVKAILLIDPQLTVKWDTLRKIAAEYKVPALRPHSADAEQYRHALDLPPLSSVGDEAEEFLRNRE